MHTVSLCNKKIYKSDDNFNTDKYEGFYYIILEPDECIKLNGKLYKGNKFGKKKVVMICDI